MTAQEVLTPHAARWACEQDYFYYGQTRLGVQGFRMCPVGAIAKYVLVVFLALLFLRVQRLHGEHRISWKRWQPSAVTFTVAAARRRASHPPAWRA